MKQGLVILSDMHAAEVPTLPAVGTVSTRNEWDGGAYRYGLARAATGALWVDRYYFKGVPDRSALAAHCQAVTSAGGYLQAGNEQNHPIEGWPHGIAGWHSLWNDLLYRYSQGNWLAMPPSPGFFGWQEWVTRDAPRLAVHAYGTLGQMQEVVRWYLDNTKGDLFITECNPGAGNRFDLNAWTHSDFWPFLDWCSQQPRIKVCLYFAWVWEADTPIQDSINAKGSEVVRLLQGWRPPKEETVKAEYPQARWVGSPNFNERPKGTVIDSIIVHATANASLKVVIDWFNMPQTVSAHYTIDKSGEIVQHVREADRAWHAGASKYGDREDFNDFSIGVELVNLNNGVDPYTLEQVQALVGLCRYLRKKYPIRKDLFLAHYDIAPIRKTDPRGLDMAFVRERAFDEWPPVVPKPEPVPSKPTYTPEQIGAAIWHIEELARQRQAAGDPLTHDVLVSTLLPALYPLRG